MITTPRTELRKEPTSGRWVLVRNDPLRVDRNGACPFCPGNEVQTPPEIAACRTNGQPPNGSGWQVRVIPERSPLLQIEGDIQREGLGMFDKVSSRGASEIVVERPDHEASWDGVSSEDIERVLWMYRERVADLYRDPQIRSVLIYRRERTPADQIDHPFSRIIGAPIVFDDLRCELATSRQYFAYKHRCLYCDIVRQERRDMIRVVEETSHFSVYTPYGSRRPFETWVVPSVHRHRFEDLSPEEVVHLAGTLQRTFRRLHAVQPNDPLEFMLHTAPNEVMRLRDDEWRTLSEDYHWHIEITPEKQTRETLGGFDVNPVPPEAAAKQLRETT
jgi:UDPglucose--hexose-1-phosphate uridylyltransferase